MKTDDLIETLATGLQPVRPAQPDGRMLIAAGLACAAAVILMIGLRPDLAQALRSSAPWLKGIYTLTVAGAAMWLVILLGRPGADPRPAIAVLLAVTATAFLSGVIDLGVTPADQRLAEWTGRTSSDCTRDILLVAAFGAPFLFLATRRFAPLRPGASGAALGVAAGAIAATAYGVLRCAETSVAFVATWYTLAIAGTGLIGSCVGRFTLRW